MGEIIWYFSFTTWLISLNIMLSSSIHAVARVGLFYMYMQYLWVEEPPNLIGRFAWQTKQFSFSKDIEALLDLEELLFGSHTVSIHS